MKYQNQLIEQTQYTDCELEKRSQLIKEIARRVLNTELVFMNSIFI